MEFEMMSLQKMNSTVTVVLTHYGYLIVTYLLCVSHSGVLLFNEPHLPKR